MLRPERAAWQALVERANVKAGQKVLIHAGSGGVGMMAIQLAMHLGTTVAATTSTANVDWVTSLGADVVVDYKRQDFATVLSGYDVVLDSLGGQTLEKSLTVVEPPRTVIGLLAGAALGLAGTLMQGVGLAGRAQR